MSPKISRLLPALLIGCAMSLLIAACGGGDSEPTTTTSAASSQSKAPDPLTVRQGAVPGVPAPVPTPVEKALRQHQQQGEDDAGQVVRRSSPKDPAAGSDASNLVERILGKATSDRSDRDKDHSREVIDRLLAKAREEGVEVVEQGGDGGGDGKGVEEILQQIGGGQP
jgi:hypothetical protein